MLNGMAATIRTRRWTAFLGSAPAWVAQSPAIYLSLLLLLAATYFGSSRDFGAFLLSVPALAALLLMAVVAALVETIRRRDRVRVLLAWAFIGLAPVAYFLSYGPVQEIRFLLWAPAHYRQLADASTKNGIVIGWDGWGMVGMDTSSYLVVDTEDRLKSPSRIDQWTKQIGQSCGLWEVRRVWPRFYIVTTYTNCPYEGIDLPN
jgi:hypothetical protein